MLEETIQAVCEHKIITIVRGLRPEHMLQLAQALYDGGLRMMEITFNQAHPETWQDTAEAIHIVRQAFEGRMHIGAGTVMSLAQLKLAYEAGAAFIISPNVDEAVIRQTKAYGIASVPGAMTPSEAAAAANAGADFVKIFPASVLGPAYFKAIASPLSHIRFIAVGGVNEKNAADFLLAGAVGLGIGGNLVNREWIQSGKFEKITELARLYVKAVH